MQNFSNIKSKVAELEADAEAFYSKGVKAAGTRLRKGMLELKALAQAVRVEVSEKKNA